MAKHDKRVKYHSAADKPVMLSLRVPRELNDRLERYASLHRQKVSALVRDGIEMRLDEPADPRSRRPGSSADAPLALVDSADPAQLRLTLVQEMEAFLERCRPLIQAARQAQPVTDTVTDTHVTDTVTDTQSQPDEAALEEARTLVALRAADEEDDQAPDEYAEAHEHFETHTTQEHVEWLTEMHKKGRLLAVPLLAAPPSPVKTARPKAAAKRKTTRTTKGRK